MGFRDQVAVVTGAASGLGRALALQLYAAGARLALGDLDTQGLAETVRLTGDSGARVSVHRVDVSDREQMGEFAAQVLSLYGQVDLLFNNAGISLVPKHFEDIPDEQFDKLLDVSM
jgi:NAD(P)-dependent dehydrogenase (short-subunit alcohol dehydrogenase family)